ncbi:hypothetical protein DY000_02044843, partial [Brassica cretica]
MRVGSLSILMLSTIKVGFLIKRQVGLEEVGIYSASDPNDVAKAGPYASLLTQNPPSPGSPTAIFVN